MNVIILEHEPYSERKNKHYFLNEFFDEDITVEYWSLQKILPYMGKVEFSYQRQEGFTKYFESINEFYLELGGRNPKETVLIVELWYNFGSRFVFEFIAKKGFKWVRIDYYLNPTKSLDVRNSFLNIAMRALREGTLFSKFKSLISRKLISKKLNVPDVLFHTGNCASYLSPAKQYVSLDYFDVITYNKKKEEATILDFRYIVFLDIMLVNHPDILMSGHKNIVDSTLYFSELELVFQKIENYFDIPVVVASHPKANYIKEFGDRIVIKDKTAELVINSDLVLTHGSLAISYALLAHKKLIYIDLKKIFDSTMFLRQVQENMYKAAQIMDAKIIDENVYQEDLKHPVNSEKYLQFLQKYYFMDEKTGNISNFTLFKDTLINL